MLATRSEIEDWVRVLGVVYPVVVALTIVGTGNRFILDALAGMLVMTIGYMAAGRLPGRGGGAILDPATRGGAVR